MRVVVIGSGVMGLSVAVLLAEAVAEVRVWSGEPSIRGVSAVAGALWEPYKAEPRELINGWAGERSTSCPRWRPRNAAEFTWSPASKPAVAGCLNDLGGTPSPPFGMLPATRCPRGSAGGCAPR